MNPIICRLLLPMELKFEVQEYHDFNLNGYLRRRYSDKDNQKTQLHSELLSLFHYVDTAPVGPNGDVGMRGGLYHKDIPMFNWRHMEQDREYSRYGGIWKMSKNKDGDWDPNEITIAYEFGRFQVACMVNVRLPENYRYTYQDPESLSILLRGESISEILH